MNLVFPKTDIKTIVFDFDGVLATNLWPNPEIGEPIPDGIRLAKEYYKYGYEVIVYTARPRSHRDGLVNWLRSHDLRFIYDVVCGKPLGALYIDDRALRFPDAFQF